MIRLIRALVDTAALRHNLGTIRAYAPRAKIMAVVKANAYGHGLVSTALALADADSFAVARLEEGMALRAAGVRAPIVLLEGYSRRSPLMPRTWAFDWNIPDPLAHVVGVASCWGALRGVDQIDTVMNAWVSGRTFLGLARLLALLYRLSLLVMTHLARADIA